MRSSIHRPEFLALVDIPSGYRVHEFRVLSEALEERGISFRAIFMSRGQKGRLWKEPEGGYGFEHAFCRGPTVYPSEDLPVHVTPGAWIDVVRSRPTWLLLGGFWFHPAVAASAYYSRALYPLFWTESWVPGGGAPSFLRSAVLRRGRGFVVPGVRSRDYVLSYGERPTLTFANTVDERIFGDLVCELRSDPVRLRESFGFDEKPVFVWPARLNPVKGILPFLEAVRGVADDCTIAIAGAGPQHDAVATAVKAMPSVKLLGHLWPDELVRLYAAGDALLLPSLFEPYGFVAVEALWAGLPLLLSTQVGALPEVLVEGENGWAVDPEDGEAVAQAFSQMISLGREGLASMGERSSRLAEERFDSRQRAAAFLDELLDRFPA